MEENNRTGVFKKYPILRFAVPIIFFVIMCVIVLARSPDSKSFVKESHNKNDYVYGGKSGSVDGIPIDHALASLFRSMPADKICFDAKNNSFLLHYPIDLDQEELAGKWVLLSDEKYRELSNNTWILSNFGNIHIIHPNITNLKCAIEKDYENL